MPVYEYKCRECGHKFELRRSLTDSHNAPVKCPRCGKSETERVYSPFSGGTRESSCTTRRFG